MLPLICLTLDIALLVLLPEIHLIIEFLVRGLHLVQVLFNLLDQVLRLRVLMPFNFFPELPKQVHAPLQSLIILVGYRIHLSLQLPKVLVVPVSLIVILIDPHNVILFTLLDI